MLKHQDPYEHLIEQNDSELIASIWGEKREKNIGGREPEALFVSVADPSVSVNDISRKVFDGIKSLPIETSYNWAKNWGRTWVTLGFDDLSIGFMDVSSNEAKKLTVLHTDKTITPQSRLTDASNGKKYFTIISNDPSTIEGLTLQVERMTDELIWCLGLRYQKIGVPPIEAYQMAINELDKEGYDILVLEREEILELRRNDDRYAVRIYGNILGEDAVPEITGAVGPFDECERPESLKPLPNSIKKPQASTQLEKPIIRDGLILNMGICVLKRPHIGHMLLAGTLEIARRSLDTDIPIVIQANDTGERLVHTIAYIAEALDIPPDQVISMISIGDIPSSSLENYYRSRNAASKRVVAKTVDVIKKLGADTRTQALEHRSIFEAFLRRAIILIPESSIPAEFSPSQRVDNNIWEGYGLAYTQIQKRRYLLEINGLLTASAMRAAVLHYSSVLLDANTHIYIDGDSSITDATNILQEQTNIRNIQYRGAAVGFNFGIASGTEGNSILMSTILEQYSQHNPSGDLLEDVVYLLHTRYQLNPQNGLPYFDYADPRAFLDDLSSAGRERVSFTEHASRFVQQIESLADATLKEIKYTSESKKAKKRLNHKLDTVLEPLSSDMDIAKRVFLKDETLLETPEVQSLIKKTMTNNGLSTHEATLNILVQIAKGQLDLESNFINELAQHGYEGEKLLEAIHTMVYGGFSLIRINSLLMQQLRAIEDIISNTLSIDTTTVKALAEKYRTLVKRLFNKNI